MDKKTYTVLSPLKHDGQKWVYKDEVELTAKEAAPLLDSGVIAEIEPEDTSDSVDQLVEAIRLLETGNENHWTADGLPNIKALSQMLDRIVTAVERDKAWALVQADNS